jgi:hypothetical protein
VEDDPTNGLVAGANLIRVGVMPFSGGFVGCRCIGQRRADNDDINAP